VIGINRCAQLEKALAAVYKDGDLHGTCPHEPMQRGEAPDAGQKEPTSAG
jgi:hypothetical protein